MKSVVWMAAGLLWLHSGFAQEVLDYKIAALDILVIDVVNEKDLPKEFKVTAKGEIPFPYLGNIKVAGFGYGDRPRSQDLGPIFARFE